MAAGPRNSDDRVGFLLVDPQSVERAPPRSLSPFRAAAPTGAFTWGVLDALLEDGRIAPKAISATSAGAMNACALVMGRVRGGDEGARQALDEFWRAVSRAGGGFLRARDGRASRPGLTR